MAQVEAQVEAQVDKEIVITIVHNFQLALFSTLALKLAIKAPICSTGPSPRPLLVRRRRRFYLFYLNFHGGSRKDADTDCYFIISCKVLRRVLYPRRTEVIFFFLKEGVA